jgi:hypothetical protein
MQNAKCKEGKGKGQRAKGKGKGQREKVTNQTQGPSPALAGLRMTGLVHRENSLASTSTL